jgi:hypothetical protein
VLFTQQELGLRPEPAPAVKPPTQPASTRAEAKLAAEKSEANEAPAKEAVAKTTVERAVAAEMAAMQQQASTRKATGGGLTAPVSLAVGASGAYFQPGIRVGAAALPGQAKPVPPAPAIAPKAPKAEAPQPDRQAESRQPDPAAERPLAAPPKRRPVAKDTGDLHEDETFDAGASAPKRRRKPFLRRTVIPISRHFWPKNWRRSWKRQSAIRAARRVEREAEQAQPQAAE